MLFILAARAVFCVFLFVGPSQSSVISRYSDFNVARLFGRQDDAPGNSGRCLPSCDLGTCGNGGSCSVGSTLSPRYLDLDASSNASSYLETTSALEKRLFTYKAGSTKKSDYSGNKTPKRSEVDAYIPAVNRGGERKYYKDPLPTVQLTGDGGLQDERAIVVASTRGVWMSHLWESYSNGRDAEGDNPDTPDDKAFSQRVLSFLKGEPVEEPVGNGYKDYIAPAGPGIDADLFNRKSTDQTSIYIFTPCNDESTTANGCKLKYPNRYGMNGEVRDTIASIFGVRRPRIVLVPYIRLNTLNPNEDAELGTNSRGAVLFQYDPNSDGDGQKAWRLFLEKRFQYQKVG
ncbi:hypothetical protein NPX13_g9596 [Xylaria arbuscula]|uniref:Uncharacterized protein n=1 Tax=Xylaria arbuscula TaxID=114810 RepID=A0A9W8N6F6_9PEZI|nr:hypothetical protein NPX13_g9596 [Xylaria arbuscula]